MAQSPFTSKQWQVSDGLPSEVVQALAQTADHQLWIGTTAGLLRFDGARFTLFDHENTPELSSDNIFSLLASKDGSLWIGSEAGGLLRLREGVFRHFGATDGLTNGFIRSVFEEADHSILVGTDGGVFRFSGDRFLRLDQDNPIPPTTGFSIMKDSRGVMWLGGTSLFRLDHGHLREFHLRSHIRTPHVRSILETKDGGMLVGTTSGLFRLNASDEFDPVPPFTSPVRVLRQTSDGTIWVGTIGEGLYTMHGFAGIPKRLESTVANKAILDVFEDAEANIWIGTQVGLERLTRTPVNIIPLADASSSDYGSVALDSDGTLWMCSKQLFRLRQGVFQRYKLGSLKGVPIRTMLRDRDKSLWVGTEGSGLFHVAPSGTRQYENKNGPVSNYIRALVQAADGSIWVGTDSGVSHISGNPIVNYHQVGGHAANVLSMMEDRNGDIWAGTLYGILHLHDGKPVTDDVTAAMQHHSVGSLHQSSDGALWIGTNDGVYERRGSGLRHYTVTEGLPKSTVYQILEGPEGRIWLSSPSGITVFTRRAWEQASEGVRGSLPLTYFPISKDFEPAELFGSIQPAGVISPSGDVWFPSSRGVVHISPSAIVPPSTFPLKITHVLVDGVTVPLATTIKLGAKTSNLTIDYAPILLSSQEAVRFRFKLDGFDRDWQEVSTRRTAYYTNLPPGSFTFRVQAYRMGNILDLQEASFSITKLSPFYRRAWFIALCAFSVAMACLAVHLLRLSRMESQFKAVLGERARVAREMHDTVIQGCTTISALLEASAGMRNLDAESSNDLNDMARKQVETTILEARKAIWNLRHGTSLEDNIETAIARIAEDATEGSTRPVSFSVTGEPFPVAATIAHELLMVIRESVHNALVHAHPTYVSIAAAFHPELLCVSVEDDGIGFDPYVLSHTPDTHFGVQGMRERMRRIGGRIDIESSPGKGTAIKITASAALCRKLDIMEPL